MHQFVSVSKALRQRKLSSKKILGINGRTRGRKQFTSNNLSKLEIQKTHLNAYGMIKGIKWRIQNSLKVFQLISTNLLGTTTIQFGEEKASQVSQLLEITIPVANLQWQSHCKGRLLMRRFEVLCFLSIATRPLDQMDFLLGFFIKHGQQFRIYIYIFFFYK